MALIGEWGFNENTGTVVADSSGNGHPGVVVSGASWTAGHYDGAVTRAGANVAVSISSLPWDSMSAITFMAWVYKGNNWLVFMGGGSGTGATRFALDGNDIAVTTTGGSDDVSGTIPIGEWHHVAGTWSSGEPIRLYIDGVLAATGSTPLTGFLSNASGDYTVITDINIGGIPVDGGNTGQIDDLRIFDTALSLSEIQGYMNSPVRPLPAPAIEYGFNEGSGSIIADSSGNGYDATITGTPWTTGRTSSGINPTNTGLVTVPAVGFYTISVYSVMAWVRRTGTPIGEANVVNAATGYSDMWLFQTDGSIRAHGGLSTGVLPLNEWHHVCFVANGTTARECYVDGNLVDSDSGEASYCDTNEPFYIGEGLGDPILTFDDLRFFGGAMLPSEIIKYMDMPVGADPGFVNKMRMNDQEVPRVYFGSTEIDRVYKGSNLVWGDE